MTRVVIAVALLAGAAVIPAQAQESRAPARVDRWTQAVALHRPGTLPATTREIAMWDWREAGPVLSYVRHSAMPQLLLRAAAMYLDIAIHLRPEERPQYPTRGTGLMANDGRAVGVHRLDSHIWWGRALVLSALQQKGVTVTERTLATAWFRTVSAIFASRLNFADLQPHLQDAVAAVPDDSGILFDAGCAFEALGSPLIQAGLASRLAEARAVRPQTAVVGMTMPPDRLLAMAEERFRAGLRLAPGNLEMRARLGRVLVMRRRSEEALTLLRSARVAVDPIVGYYADLFLGDALTDLGQYPDALDALEAARRRFPQAASPRLGISRVFAEMGEYRQARAALARTPAGAVEAPLSSDPRWYYDRCMGRHDKAVYAGFVERLIEVTR